MSTRRILALHGYSQNSSVFHKKTGALRRALRKDNIDIVYTDAPHILSKGLIHGSPPGPDEESLRGWYTFNDVEYAGIEDSLNYIRNMLENEGPFEGIISFSQGASLTGILCAMYYKDPPPFFSQLKYVIFASSFLPRVDKYLSLFPKDIENTETPKIDIPTFHFYGTTDAIITPENSTKFLQLFSNPHSYQHPGGHFIPANAQPMRELRSFISQIAS